MYKIEFTSWENDADDYCTLAKFLSSKADVDFYKALGDLFKSTNSSPHGMGNEEHEEDILQEILTDLLQEHSEMSPSVREAWERAIKDDCVYDKLCEEVISDPVQYDYRFCRVVESTHIQAVKAGSWLMVGNEKVVFIDSEGDTVSYRVPAYPVKKGKPDIFCLEWKLNTCSLSDIEYLGKPDEVSTEVARLV